MNKYSGFLMRSWLFCFLFSGLMLPVFGDDLAKVIKIEGKAEIKRSGSHAWEFAKSDLVLLDNDMLRTYEKSRVEIEYTDVSLLFVGPNTQILLNASAPGDRHSASKYVTALFGAIYFIVKEALPKSGASKVYTPTTVITIRGTAFYVEVDKKSGSTDVCVTDGTVLAGNILQGEERFISAGNWFRISLNESPKHLREMQETDYPRLEHLTGTVSRLPEWAGLRKRMEELRALPAAGGRKIAIVAFTDKSDYRGKWNLSQSLTAQTAEGLRKMTLDEVVVLSNTGEDWSVLGKKAQARLVLGGEIRSFSLNRKAEINPEGNQYMEYSQFTLDGILFGVDPRDGALLKRADVEATLQGSPGELSQWQATVDWPLELSDKRLRESLIGKAVEQWIRQVKEQIGPLLVVP